MMWALLRKNLWMWRPSRSANVPVFLAAIAFSVGDCLWRFPAEAWALPCCIVILLGFVGASSAVNIDLKNDNIRFLEYLPVRWSDVWLANWLDQFLACLVVIALLCWGRVAIWVAPATEHFTNPAEKIFETRWILPLSLSAGVFAVYSYTIFWRTFFASDKASILPIILGSIFFLSLPMALVMLMQVSPQFVDLLPLAFLVGAVLSLFSFIGYAWPPRYWSGTRRFLLVGLPLALLAFSIEIWAVWSACVRWQQLDWTEPRQSFSMGTASLQRAWVLANVESPRSGLHQFTYHLHTGALTYLGRNLALLTNEFDAQGGHSLIYTSQRRGRWSPLASPVMMLDADGKKTQLLPNNVIINESGRKDTFTRAWVTAKFVFLQGNEYDNYTDGSWSRVTIFAFDKQGNLFQQFELHGSDQVLVNDEGMILTTSYTGTNPGDNPSNAPKYQLHDVASGLESDLQLPGRALCFSDDLKKVIYLGSNIREGTTYNSIGIFDLVSHQKRTVLEEGVIPPIPVTDHTDRYDYFNPLPPREPFGTSATNVNPAISVNTDFTKMIVVANRLDQSESHLSLVLVDLNSGKHRTLVPESVIGPRPAEQPFEGLYFLGFAPDQESYFFKSQSKLQQVRLTDGKISETVIPGNHFNLVEFSPGGKRILFTRSQLIRSSSMEIYDLPASKVLYQSSGEDRIQWLDDEHIIVTNSKGAAICDVTGKWQTQVLPPG